MHSNRAECKIKSRTISNRVFNLRDGFVMMMMTYGIEKTENRERNRDRSCSFMVSQAKKQSIKRKIQKKDA